MFKLIYLIRSWLCLDSRNCSLGAKKWLYFWVCVVCLGDLGEEEERFEWWGTMCLGVVVIWVYTIVWATCFARVQCFNSVIIYYVFLFIKLVLKQIKYIQLYEYVCIYFYPQSMHCYNSNLSSSIFFSPLNSSLFLPMFFH